MPRRRWNHLLLSSWVHGRVKVPRTWESRSPTRENLSPFILSTHFLDLTNPLTMRTPLFKLAYLRKLRAKTSYACRGLMWSAATRRRTHLVSGRQRSIFYSSMQGTPKTLFRRTLMPGGPRWFPAATWRETIIHGRVYIQPFRMRLVQQGNTPTRLLVVLKRNLERQARNAGESK